MNSLITGLWAASLVCFLMANLSGCQKTYSADMVLKGPMGTNRYEIIDIGDYRCVGMDGDASGAIWCENTKTKK